MIARRKAKKFRISRAITALSAAATLPDEKGRLEVRIDENIELAKQVCIWCSRGDEPSDEGEEGFFHPDQDGEECGCQAQLNRIRIADLRAKLERIGGGK